MSGTAAGLGLKRPVGRALIVGGAPARSQPLAAMQALGFECAEIDDPYAAAAELFRRPLVYRALVLSLTSFYREELPIIATLKRRLPHVEVWLAQIDARQAALAEAVRLGADGLLGEDGLLHRIQGTAAPAAPTPANVPSPAALPEPALPSQNDGEPILSADELRALLEEQPSLPPEASA